MTDEEKLNSRHSILRIAYRLLKESMRQILDGECAPEEVADFITSVSPARRGYKKESDYLTIDKGMKELNMGQNRVKFCNLMKDNGIENETFNNVHIGYKKKKILAIKDKSKSH